MVKVDPVTLKTKVNGKTVKIKPKLSWGELKELAKAGDVEGRFVPLNALEKLLEIAIVDGIDTQNRTEMMQIDAEEFTAMIGEIQKIIPLEKYLKNLNIDEAILNQTL